MCVCVCVCIVSSPVAPGLPQLAVGLEPEPLILGLLYLSISISIYLSTYLCVYK